MTTNESKSSSELEAIYETGHYRGSEGWLRLHSKLQQHLQPKGAAGAIFNGKISKADAEAADTTTHSSAQSDAEREMEEGLRELRRLSMTWPPGQLACLHSGLPRPTPQPRCYPA